MSFPKVYETPPRIHKNEKDLDRKCSSPKRSKEMNIKPEIRQRQHEKEKTSLNNVHEAEYGTVTKRHPSTGIPIPVTTEPRQAL
jgi:hypothetical protein